MRPFFPIVFEDHEILIIEKPSGIVVNASETTKEETVYDRTLLYLDQKTPGVGGRAGIVHRLDKDTSGLLIIAKNETAFVSLQAQFKEGKVNKEYIALVHGNVVPPEGEISAPILRNPFNRKRFGIFPGGRAAKTLYTVVDHFRNNEKDFSLLLVKPLTGRTHQIRVHLKHIGYPIVSDLLYGGRKTVKADLQFCPRLFLHASKISFFHPKTNQRLSFSSKLPNDLEKILRNLTT